MHRKSRKPKGVYIIINGAVKIRPILLGLDAFSRSFRSLLWLLRCLLLWEHALLLLLPCCCNTWRFATYLCNRGWRCGWRLGIGGWGCLGGWWLGVGAF